MEHLSVMPNLGDDDSAAPQTQSPGDKSGDGDGSIKLAASLTHGVRVADGPEEAQGRQQGVDLTPVQHFPILNGSPNGGGAHIGGPRTLDGGPRTSGPHIVSSVLHRSEDQAHISGLESKISAIRDDLVSMQRNFSSMEAELASFKSEQRAAQSEVLAAVRLISKSLATSGLERGALLPPQSPFEPSARGRAADGGSAEHGYLVDDSTMDGPCLYGPQTQASRQEVQIGPVQIEKTSRLGLAAQILYSYGPM